MRSSTTWARRTAIAIAGIVVLAGPAMAEDTDSQTDVMWSVEVARGRYGLLDNSTIVTMPFVLRHRQGRWTAQVDAPLVRIDSTERLVPGIGAVGASAGGLRSVATGLGDVWLKLSYDITPALADATGIAATLKLKTATGDFDRGLGSGGTDVALQVEALRGIGALTLFGHLGWRRTGDVAGFTRYRDPWYAEFGAMLRYSPACEWGVFYDHRQAIGRLGAIGEVTAFGACRYGAQRVQIYVTRGMQPASPDVALGLGIRHRF